MKNSAVMYSNFTRAVAKLPAAMQGEAYAAYMAYATSGEEYAGDNYAIAALLEAFRDQIDEDRNKYQAKAERVKKLNTEKSERNRDDIVPKSNRNRNENGSVIDIDIVSKERVSKDTPKKAASRFTPPSVEEIRAYCQERGNHVDPQRFYDFYASKGWKVGNQSMKDWKACVRTWEQRDDKFTHPMNLPAKPQQGMQRDEDLDAMLIAQISGRSSNEHMDYMPQERGAGYVPIGFGP